MPRNEAAEFAELIMVVVVVTCIFAMRQILQTRQWSNSDLMKGLTDSCILYVGTSDQV